MDGRSEHSHYEIHLILSTVMRAILALALLLVCVQVLSVSYLTARINEDAVVDAYNRGRKDALNIKPVSAELEYVCAAIWMDQNESRK